MPPTDPQLPAPPGSLPAHQPHDADGEATTGIRHTPESALLALVAQIRELREEIEALRSATWSALLREQLDRPIWPGRWEMRLGTLLVLLAALVALFGSDRVAGWLPGWLSPSVAAP